MNRVVQIRTSEIRGTCHRTPQPQKSAKLQVPAFASGAMHFCSSQNTAGAEATLHKRAQERSREKEGRELFIADFTVTSLKPTWKRQAKHSKSPNFLSVSATTAVFV